MINKILIVEDDPLMARLYERMLRLDKYEVEMAVDGQDALAKLEEMEVKPMLIMLDIMMPKLNGFEVLKFLKKHPELKSIPVIMLTNLAGREEADRALELGAVLYLVKSQYEPKEILQKIREIVVGYQEKTGGVPEVKVTTKDLKE